MYIKFNRDFGVFGSSLIIFPTGTVLRLGEPFRVTPSATPSDTLFYSDHPALGGILFDITDPDVTVLSEDAGRRALESEHRNG